MTPLGQFYKTFLYASNEQFTHVSIGESYFEIHNAPFGREAKDSGKSSAIY